MCHDERSGRVNLIVSTYPGHRYESLYVGRFDPSGRLAWESMGSGTQLSAIWDCTSGDGSWAWNGSFRPCACGSAVARNPQGDHLRILLSDLRGALRTGAGVSQQELAELIERMDRFQPMLEWNVQTSLSAETFELPDYSVAVVTHDSEENHSTSFQYVLGRRAGGDERWQRLYTAPLWSFGFFPMRVYGFLDGGLLDVEMCVGDCGGLSRYGRFPPAYWAVVGRRSRWRSSPRPVGSAR